MEREVGGRIGMGNTCKPMAVSFQCMTKSTKNKKKKKKIGIIHFPPTYHHSGFLVAAQYYMCQMSNMVSHNF